MHNTFIGCAVYIPSNYLGFSGCETKVYLSYVCEFHIELYLPLYVSIMYFCMPHTVRLKVTHARFKCSIPKADDRNSLVNNTLEFLRQAPNNTEAYNASSSSTFHLVPGQHFILYVTYMTHVLFSNRTMCKSKCRIRENFDFSFAYHFAFLMSFLL